MLKDKELKEEFEKDQKGRTFWQKFIRGLWISLGCILGLLIFFFISMIQTEDDDAKDITDNQIYVIKVSHEANTYTYYCTFYIKNPVNSSFILFDYNIDITNEIMIQPGIYFRIEKNPRYKKEYFKKKEKKEKKEEKFYNKEVPIGKLV